MNYLFQKNIFIKYFSFIFIICFSNILFAQTRVTSITNEGTKLITFLSSYENQNYIVSVSPEDTVKFYLLGADNSQTLIRKTTIPFAYKSQNSLKMVKEKYFVIFSDIEIYNYNFIDDVVTKKVVNNPLPTGYGFGIYDREQESVEFALNGVQYMYYYKENRLEICTLSIREKFNDHLILFDGKNLFYSNDYGNTKRKLLELSQKPFSTINAYETYALVTDSTGHVLKCFYNGTTDTLLTVSRPITRGNRNVLETEEFLVVITSPLFDSTYVDVYTKTDLTYVNTLRLDHGVTIDKNQFIQKGNTLVMFDSKNKFTTFNVLTNNKYRSKKIMMYMTDQFFSVGDKIFLYRNNGLDFSFITLDVNTLEIKEIYKTTEQIFYQISWNQWFKNSNLYYYNKPGNADTKFISLYSFDESFEAFSPVVTEEFFSGVDRSSPLITLGDRVFLCADDLYEIKEQTYEKISQNRLLQLTTFSGIRYKIYRDNIIYVEEYGSEKKYYAQDAQSNTLIFIDENDIKIEEILTFGNYVFFVDIWQDLYQVNISDQTVKKLEDDVLHILGLNKIFHNGRYLFYTKNPGLILYDPVTGEKKILTTDDLDFFNPLLEMKGKTYILKRNKISILTDEKTLEDLPSNFQYTNPFSGLIVNNEKYYFVARENNRNALYKFDGNILSKITEGNLMEISSVSNNILVYSQLGADDITHESRVYDDIQKALYIPATKNGARLQQVIDFNNIKIGFFQTEDSLYLVKYNDDYTDYEVLFSTYDPFEFDASIVGSAPKNRVLISTGRKFIYLNENLKVKTLSNILPNTLYRSIHLTDSIYYFMAIGNPFGNQVYHFNHEEFERLTGIKEIVQTKENLKIYPNPASDFILISENEDMIHSELPAIFTIIDATGKVVSIGNHIKNEVIPIDNLQPGYYLIIRYDTKNIMTGSFIKYD
jgi:hypothetical protein